MSAAHQNQRHYRRQQKQHQRHGAVSPSWMAGGI